jgi:hypothetical protein
MRSRDVALAHALNDFREDPPEAPLSNFAPKQEARPFPPEILAKAKRLHLAQLTIAEIHAAGWGIIPTADGICYESTAFAGTVSGAVQRAVKMLKDEIKECLAYEGRA